jgi:hypothetical protein
MKFLPFQHIRRKDGEEQFCSSGIEPFRHGTAKARWRILTECRRRNDTIHPSVRGPSSPAC